MSDARIMVELQAATDNENDEAILALIRLLGLNFDGTDGEKLYGIGVGIYHAWKKWAPENNEVDDYR